MADQPIRLRREYIIRELHSIHYLELTKKYVFSGETHDFWEVLFVDRGSLLVTVGDTESAATAGNLFFIAPGQFHAFRGNGEQNSNVLLIGFSCNASQMEIFRNVKINAFSTTIMQIFLREGRKAFVDVLRDPHRHTLVRREPAKAEAETLLSITATEMLVWSKCRLEKPTPSTRPVILNGRPMLSAILSYMREHVGHKLTLKQLADEFHVSTSYIQRLFTRYKNASVMRTFTLLKLERARELLRGREYNITQIAELLGYDNIYYFCNQFKKEVGMSPMEYRRSITNYSDKTD